MEPLTVIVGPTAAGKTRLGIKLAKEQNGAVVSADSRQIYAGLNIGTAKPREAWKNDSHDIMAADPVENVPHYFLNTYSPTEKVSLSHWQQDAFKIIDHLIEQDKSPLLVGGTMLYVDSIVFNYYIPKVSPNEELRNMLEQENVKILYDRLVAQDPHAAQFIEPHNKLRIIRALEVISATGRPFSHLRQKGPRKYACKIIGVFPGWEALTKNITERAYEMWKQGLVEETKHLISRYGSDLPLLKTMNYVQTIKYLNNKLSQDEAIQEIIRVNLRYARRQMSWWKNREDIEWI